MYLTTVWRNVSNDSMTYVSPSAFQMRHDVVPADDVDLTGREIVEQAIPVPGSVVTYVLGDLRSQSVVRPVHGHFALETGQY